MLNTPVNSLVDLLELRARQDEGRFGFTFLSDDGNVDEGITYKELDCRARSIATQIMEMATPGERVLLLYPPGLEFFPAFFGSLYAALMAVPAYPPHRNRSLLRLQSIVQDSQPRLVLTTAALLPGIKDVISVFGRQADIHVIATDQLLRNDSVRYIRPGISQNTIAFLQYTSGSTANPKGVMLTHGNLLHNAALVNDAVGPTPDDSYVSWLPVFHDMGFMGGILQPLYRGLPSVLMAPAGFLEKPVRWLQAISRFRATASGGPSFAYELCVRRVAHDDLAGIDLSSWTVAFNGAEPVRADVIDRFVSAFAQCGFRRNAFYPCYGLAEATLMVSGGRKGQAVVVAGFDRRELESHRVRRSAANERVHSLVACGRNLPGQEIAIVHPESHQRCAPDEIGEIWVTGPSVAAGYWNNPALSHETFNGRVHGSDPPYLRTGDLGFLHNEQLFVTGRIKDLLIIRGQNHYPQDIELTVQTCDPVLRPGSGAAFSIEAGNEERLVVVQEATKRANNDWDRIFAVIRRAIAEDHELAPHAIILIRTGTIQKTSSGKIQRTACKEAFSTGQLRILSAWYEQEQESPALTRSEQVVADETIQLGPVATRLVYEIARKTGVALNNIALDQPITAYGLDSLAATELVHQLQVEFNVNLQMADLFEGLTLEEIVRQAEQTQASNVALPPQSPESHTYSITHGQRAILFLQQMAPHSSAYNIARAVRITSKVDVDLLRRSFQALVDRHPALRTTFVFSYGEPVQQVHRETRVLFEHVDVSSLSEAGLVKLLLEKNCRVFDLATGPLFCACLYSRSEQDHVLQLVIHHLIADFWSLMVLLDDLGKLYHAWGQTNSVELPPLKYSYADFVFWQDQVISGSQGERLWSYWRQVLSGEIVALNLPVDYPRPPVSSFRGASLEFVINPVLAAQLKRIALEGQTTLFMVLLAAYQVLLYRLTCHTRFAIGVPTSGRALAEFSEIAGYFVNVLPIVADFAEPAAFVELLTDLRQRTVESFAHDLYPFPLMVEKLGIPRSFNSSPIFQTMFVFQKAQGSQSSDFVALAMGQQEARFNVGSLELEPFPLPEQNAQFDLVLTLGEAKHGLLGAWQYSTDLLDIATVARWSQSFLRLLREIVVDPRCLVNELPIIPEDQLTRLLLEFNQTELEYDRRPMHEQIAHRALLHPDRTAVACGRERISYRELDARASQIALYLHRQGIRREDLVAICMKRSPAMVAAMLAVWKIGAAYVPLDPQYPAERLRFMLEDTCARFVLTEQELLSSVGGTAATALDLNKISECAQEDTKSIDASFAAEQLAYVIYTSGSTGTPKGVMLTHQSVSSFVAWARNAFSAEEFSGVLATTSICFDLSIFELWATLSCGGAVILTENILEWCDQWASADAQPPVRLINTVPSAIEKVLERGLPASISTINLAGEALQEGLVRKILETGVVSRVNNLYGPTETTTYSTWTTVTGEDHVTIGRAIANTQLYVLDTTFQLVPIGVVGELYIGGVGLARGFWRHPEWTAERFIANPFSTVPGERLFRTGDLVRWQADGRLLYVGRVDQQVKIRGFRIELGEISAVLGRWKAVRENVVVVIEESSDKHLVAYVSPVDDALTPEAIRDYLRHRLPEYTIPNHIVLLPDLPKTSNGKIDRKALPLPQRLSVSRGRLPETEIEREIAAIWQAILKIEKVGIDDDFFLLGGHSLLMMQLKARLEARSNRTISLARLLQSPTVAGMAKAIEPLPRTNLLPPVPRAAQDSPAELSFAQERIWFLEQMFSGSSVYNVAGAVRLKGKMNKQAVCQSLRQIVQRHAVLRTAFVVADRIPIQQVDEEVQFALEETDLRSVCDGHDIEELLRSNLEQEAKRTFFLYRAPLMRARLFQTGEHVCTLVVVLHHIVADGWSIGVLLRELEHLYGACCEARPSALPSLNFQFADYALWQRHLLRAGDMNEGLDYWRQQLSGTPPVLDFTADTPRPAQPTYQGNIVEFALGRERDRKLREFCRVQEITPYVLLLGCFQLLLSRYSGQADLVVGSPMADRSHVESEGLIGPFANLVPVRAKIDGEETLSSFVRQLKLTVTQAQTWQHIPFEKIVEQVEAQRNASHLPLVQVVFAWQIGLMGSLRLGEIVAHPHIVHTGTAKFDLTLTIEQDKNSELIAWIEFSRDIFNENTIRPMAARYLRLMEQAVSYPERRVGDLSLLDEQERKQILFEWNGASLQPQPRCVQLLFEQQAQQCPDAIAVVAGTRRLNYRDLNAISNQVAHLLIAHGIGSEVIVGICFQRSEWMIVAILAVWKAGAAYLPLDPEYPPDRLAYMLNDARAVFILSEDRSSQKIPKDKIPALLLDRDREQWQKQSTENPRNRTPESSLAYIIYTSGSTGQPKGVMVQRGNLAGLLVAADAHFGFRSQDRWTLFHLYSFDFSVWEMWGALAYGGTLVIVPEEARRSPRHLCRLLREESISILSQVPSAFYQLLDYEQQAGEPAHVELRAVVLGGEALDVTRLEPWIKRHGYDGPLLVNMYGITETTIHVTFKQLRADDIIAGRSVIGLPLPDYRTWVLDQHQMLLPPGIPGEIYVGGTGVARGYLNRPDLTAERFVPDPFGNQEGRRLYRTGDLGRYLADGTMEYLGRIDHQVKIRGYRIELGEIESKLKRHVSIDDCAVLVKPDATGDHRLVAYIATARSEALPSASIRIFLKSELPDYMVPAQFVFLDRLPLTPNGKIDRKRLLQLEVGTHAEALGAAILDPTEELIAGVWFSLLGVTELSADSDFFDLGGHSLLATQMLLQLRQVFGCDVALRSLFEFSRLGELAAHIRTLTHAPDRSPAAAILCQGNQNRHMLSSGQQRLWFLDQFAASSHAYNVTGAARLRGELDHQALRQSFQAILRRHEILRTGFIEQKGSPELIHPPIKFDLETRDLTGHPRIERRLAAELRRESAREFVLSEPPLLRAVLFQLYEQEHVLMVAMHHIIADAWSVEIVVRELAQFYSEYHAGPQCEIPELPFQYRDYAAWEHDRWTHGDFTASLDYWRQQLADAPHLEMPADLPREAVPSYQGKSLQTVLDTDLSQKLKTLGHRENVTLFMVLVAGFQALLSQYTGEEDVVVGTSVANRNNFGTENLIGLFTNEVVLRAQLQGDPTLRELLARVRGITLSAYEHQDVPFERVVQALRPERDFSRNPFFQATILLNHDPLPKRQFGNLSLEPVELEIETAIFDLSVIFTVGPADRIRVSLRHSTRFKTESMEQLLKDLIAVFNFMVQKPEGCLSDLQNFLSCAVDRDVPRLVPLPVRRPWDEFVFTGQNIPHVFEEQVLATPGNVAVRYEEQCLTFAELNEKANRVANCLLSLGLKSEDYVALCLERSVEMMVAILGILKAGAAYLPLDRTYPGSRLQYIIEEAAPAVILTQQSLTELFTGLLCNVVYIDDDSVAGSSPRNPAVSIHPDNLAYAIYTSGSSGTPKGVMVQHRSALNLLQGLEQSIYSGNERSVCVSMNAPVVFDASVKQWIRLLKGNSVCILPEEKRFDPEALLAYIKEKNIDVLDCTPSVLRLMLDEDPMQSVPLKTVLIGGEAIDAPTWQRLREQGQIEFYNVYGPTECTVDVSVCRISESSQPSIGYPINNVRVYILNDNLQSLPPGQIGELCVAGVGLARGYCHRPDLTAEKFMPDPISGVPGSRLYRTGDLARLLPGGGVEFRGRHDDQVKIRGYRVELEEIALALRKIPGVRDAVVLTTQTNTAQSRLLAHVVPEPSVVLNPEHLRYELRRQLPEYMTPSGFVILDKLPVTVNGKVDRNALALMSDAQRMISSTYAPARNRMEETVTVIWQEVLGVREAGIHDNFFDLGGHSLAMVKVRFRLREVLNKEVPMVELFRNPTIALLSRYLQEGQAKTPSLQVTQSRAGRRIKAANQLSK